MREFVLLDSGPLGQAVPAPGMASADQCRLWIDGAHSTGRRSGRARDCGLRSASGVNADQRSLGRSVVSMIWSHEEDCRTSPYRLPLGVKPPSSGRTPASSAYQPRRPMPWTPTSSWRRVQPRSVILVIRSLLRRRMSVISPAIATPGCGRPSSEFVVREIRPEAHGGPGRRCRTVRVFDRSPPAFCGVPDQAVGLRRERRAVQADDPDT